MNAVLSVSKSYSLLFLWNEFEQHCKNQHIEPEYKLFKLWLEVNAQHLSAYER
jgi:hypothetical protein